MSGLPKGWVEVCLRDIILHVPNIKPENFPEQEFGYVDISSIDNVSFTVTDAKRFLGKSAPSRARRPIQANDVLFSNVRTYLKNIAIVQPEAPVQLCSTGFTVLRPSPAVHPFFLFRYVLTDTFIDKVTPQQTGTHYPATSDRVVTAEKIPLPPLNEQRRIVARVEALLSKVDACQKRLVKISVILKRFRQAVLAAACSGRLTADWRQTQGRSEGEELPGGWRVCSVGDVGKVCNGSTPSRKCPGFWNGTIPWVSSGEVRNNFITTTRESISKEGNENSSVRLLPAGTVLLAMIGEGKTRGQTAILEIEATINQNVAAVIIDREMILSRYLWYWFRQQYETTRQSGGGSGPQALNCKRVRELPLNLPPLPEQREIVRRLDALFTLADQLDDRHAKGKTHVDRLTQSILAKAFRGELVPQDESDEPASVLLERICAQREQAAPAKRRGVSRRTSVRKSSEKKPATEPPLPLVAKASSDYTRNVPETILTHMKPGIEYSRSEITAATGITATDWTWAIRQLKEEGKVVQVGERRGARYLTKPFSS